MDLHPEKTVLFGSTAAARRALAIGAPDARVVTEFRDLGLGQAVAGNSRPKNALQRAAACTERFRRLATLPLPFPLRVQATAAAGVAAAVWGALGDRPPAVALRKLRTAAGRASWRGGRFGAVELRLLLGAPNGRVDPAYHFASAPLLQLAKAIQGGS